jgi:hypothetical protein
LMKTEIEKTYAEEKGKIDTILATIESDYA